MRMRHWELRFHLQQRPAVRKGVSKPSDSRPLVPQAPSQELHFPGPKNQALSLPVCARWYST